MVEVLPKPEEEKLLPPSSAKGLAGSISQTSGTGGSDDNEATKVSAPEYTTEPVRVNGTASPIYLIVLLLILFHFFAPRDFRDSIYAKIGEYIPVEVTVKMKAPVPAVTKPADISTPSAEDVSEATPASFEELPFE